MSRGREFPQLPEPIAQTLQKLWIQALEGAHEALDHSVQAREAALILQEQENERVTAHLKDREHTSAARNAALEDSLTLAREQLLAANRRAEVLERSLQERAQEALRWRARADALESLNLQLRSKEEADSARAPHRAHESSGEARRCGGALAHRSRSSSPVSQRDGQTLRDSIKGAARRIRANADCSATGLRKNLPRFAWN